MFNAFQNELETVLKIFRYSIQPPVYKETMKELTEIYGNFSFLHYDNVTGISKLETTFMTSNPDARVFLCKYAGKIELLNPNSCDLFSRSITNEGFGYSFNMANFWDIFSNASYNQNFSNIMRPKGYDQDPSPSGFDENDDAQRWVYPKDGVQFPKVKKLYNVGSLCIEKKYS